MSARHPSLDAWHTEPPTECGYYLVTWRSGDRLTVSEAWRNIPDIKHKPREGAWWFARGYLASREKSESVAALGHIRQMRPELVYAAIEWARVNCQSYLPIPDVVAWAYLPKPYKSVER